MMENRKKILSILLSAIIIISCAIPMVSCDSSIDETDEIGIEDIDNMIQGTWKNASLGTIGTYMYVTFNNGDFETGIKLASGVSSGISVTGKYVITDGTIALTKENGEAYSSYNYTIEEGSISKLIEGNGDEWKKMN